MALERLAALVAEWLQLRGMNAELVAATVASDYAGQANKLHIKTKASKAATRATEHVAPQRQARHLAA